MPNGALQTAYVVHGIAMAALELLAIPAPAPVDVNTLRHLETSRDAPTNPGGKLNPRVAVRQMPATPGSITRSSTRWVFGTSAMRPVFINSRSAGTGSGSRKRSDTS
ncbi:hypothetical protein BH23ACT3_BH23ACT3_23990 [soil metagenome]